MKPTRVTCSAGQGRNFAAAASATRACPLARRAFSLLELLIVIAIVVVLTTLYWGSGTQNKGQKAQANCRKNLEKLYLALEIYSNDYPGKYPVVTGALTSEAALDVLVPRYNADTSLLKCPGSNADAPIAGESLMKSKISYAYYMGRKPGDGQAVVITDRQVDSSAKAIGQAVFSTNGKGPASNHPHGGNLLYCDGHAEAIPALAPMALPLAQGVVLLNPKP